MKNEMNLESAIKAIFIILSEIAKKLDPEYIEYYSSLKEEKPQTNEKYIHNKIGFEYERK